MVIIINLFGQVFNVSVCSEHQKVFAIACAFDIMLRQQFFNYNFCGGTSLPTRIFKPSSHHAQS